MDSMKSQVESLLPEDVMLIWNELTGKVDALYDVDRIWNKGFGSWKVECKYRRGGKTLCTFYAREGVANLLITYGKVERDKFEIIKPSVSKQLQDIYDNTVAYHDGKWLWIPLEGQIEYNEIMEMLKIKRRPNRKIK